MGVHTDAIEAGEDGAECVDVGRFAAQEVADQAGLLGLDALELLRPVVRYPAAVRKGLLWQRLGQREREEGGEQLQGGYGGRHGGGSGGNEKGFFQTGCSEQ